MGVLIVRVPRDGAFSFCARGHQLFARAWPKARSHGLIWVHGHLFFREFSATQGKIPDLASRVRISLFRQAILIFSSARSEIFVDQPDPMENELRRSDIFGAVARQMPPLRGSALQRKR